MHSMFSYLMLMRCKVLLLNKVYLSHENRYQNFCIFIYVVDKRWREGNKFILAWYNLQTRVLQVKSIPINIPKLELITMKIILTMSHWNRRLICIIPIVIPDRIPSLIENNKIIFMFRFGSLKLLRLPTFWKDLKQYLIYLKWHLIILFFHVLIISLIV